MHADLVNLFAPGECLADRQLLVFGPAHRGGLGSLLLAFGGRGFRRKPGNHLPQRMGARKFLPAAIRFQHLPKKVGGPQSDVGDRTIGRRIVQRQRIFQFMGQFAQFAVATRRRVSL